MARKWKMWATLDKGKRFPAVHATKADADEDARDGRENFGETVSVFLVEVREIVRKAKARGRGRE